MKRELALISKQVFLCCSITSRYMRLLRHQYDQAGECSVNRTLNDLQVIVAHHRELKHNPLEILELKELQFIQDQMNVIFVIKMHVT